MSDAGKGYTEPGPILWEADVFAGLNPFVALTARTPEHPATDRRFMVRYRGSEAQITDQTDPETPETWPTLARAILEAEDTIRAAWYEGGGGEKVAAPLTLTAAEYRGMIGRAIDEHALTVEVADRLGVELCRPCLEDNGECRLPDSCGRYCDEAGRHGPDWGREAPE
ncbi:MAG: hypothetical protein OXU74_06535 [Gemmatimonadota bacterium]|nr:hypothetical protein [Gemmatimonadota bacterium]